MAIGRTTIMMSEVLQKRVADHVEKDGGGKLQDFYNTAIINQLEREGDFEIRDLVEEDYHDSELEKQSITID